jgi:hypothetical protein
MVKGSIEWEHDQEGLVLRIKPALGELINGETRKHALAARREMLLAFRSLIDIAVKRLEEKEKQTEKPVTKKAVE